MSSPHLQFGHVAQRIRPHPTCKRNQKNNQKEPLPMNFRGQISSKSHLQLLDELLTSRIHRPFACCSRPLFFGPPFWRPKLDFKKRWAPTWRETNIQEPQPKICKSILCGCVFCILCNVIWNIMEYMYIYIHISKHKPFWTRQNGRLLKPIQI